MMASWIKPMKNPALNQTKEEYLQSYRQLYGVNPPEWLLERYFPSEDREPAEAPAPEEIDVEDLLS